MNKLLEDNEGKHSKDIKYEVGNLPKVNAALASHPFTAGAWWRPRDAFILSVGIDAGSFRFGYSYDITISPLTNASGGSHELSLGFNFSCKEKPKRFRTISCPSF